MFMLWMEAFWEDHSNQGFNQNETKHALNQPKLRGRENLLRNLPFWRLAVCVGRFGGSEGGAFAPPSLQH